ncbi:MAG: TIGR03663 family protein [Anaerolineae bacterium]|nr:TIGR03663 family protein [Anaerolineae bacterium]
MEAKNDKRSSWLDRPLFSDFKWTWEKGVFAVIVLLAVISRFYDLEPRVMSHDESLHTYFSWLLYKGRGFVHTPLTHGPLQFHLIALSYFIFGDSDFSARIPAVLASILTIGFLWNFRRYLGRVGTIVAAGLFLISPYMLYYGRYVRNEPLVALFGVITLWAVLRYLDTGEKRYIYYLTAATVLHFTSKETSFIYTAQALLFLGFLFMARLSQRRWGNPSSKDMFTILLVISMVLLGAAVVSGRLGGSNEILSGSETAPPPIPGETLVEESGEELPGNLLPVALAALGVLALLGAGYNLAVGIDANNPEAENIQSFMLSFLSVLALTAATGAFSWYSQKAGLLLPQGDIPSQIGLFKFISADKMPFAVLGISTLLGTLLALAAYMLMTHFKAALPSIAKERSLDLIILLMSLVLPHLTAFPVNWLGGNATDYANFNVIIQTSTILIPLALLSVGVGIGWNLTVWLNAAGLFYGIFIMFFTTFFTNESGFLSGLVGSLGYWLEQQDVKRGNQPWYYYIAVQVPIYEYLGALATTLAAGLGVRWWLNSPRSVHSDLQEDEGSADPTEELYDEDGILKPANSRKLALMLLAFWVVTSVIAYSAAGEKMPWLTVHIALPMLLLGGWALGRLIDSIDWKNFLENRGWLGILLLPVVVTSLLAAMGSILGTNPPFQGKELLQLEATSSFILSLATMAASGVGLAMIWSKWEFRQIAATVMLAFFALLGLWTTRTAITATYINYDRATEYLVYAHSARGVKDVMERVEDISLRLTDGLDIGVAYDDDISWPFTWYLRNYNKQRYYGQTPDRELRSQEIILVGDNNFSQIEPIVRLGYHQFDYIRMWWPNQDYFNISWDSINNEFRRDLITEFGEQYTDQPEMTVFGYISRVWQHLSPFFTDKQVREAVWQIWMNRDYSQYASLNGRQDFNLADWRPADTMRMYVRKDVAALLWDYGASEQEILLDPCEEARMDLVADLVIELGGEGAGPFNGPRGIAVAPDNSLYIADSRNHRIVHVAENGNFLQAWGQPSQPGSANEGELNEPWGVAISPDGNYVYVADTWNHRIQKFTANGTFITMWGINEQGGTSPYGFWGPRGIAVDQAGNVYITDTGNKRVVIFDENGGYLGEFGGFGFGDGQLDEPVGIAIDPNTGWIYVADTWNQRVQAFEQVDEGFYVFAKNWDVTAWYSNSLENKPYITVGGDSNVFISDPEDSRVMVYNSQGEYSYCWLDTTPSMLGSSLMVGIVGDGQGGMWVSDARNNRLLHYSLP